MTSAPVRPLTDAMACAGIGREEMRRELAPRQEKAREHDARARREVERDRLELVERAIRDDRDAAHLAARADRHVAQEPELAHRRGGGDGEKPDVGLLLGERARELAGSREAEVEPRRRP